MLKNSAEHERDILSTKFTAISRQVSPNLLLDVSAGICQRGLVDELLTPWRKNPKVHHRINNSQRFLS
jgi:hypothetical protein